MSLMLKGIDLPEKNMKVICLFPKGAEELVVLDADRGATAGRPIEVIQMPKDHGRLIDADELVKHLRKDPLFDLVERYGISGVIESRPTILEAEDLL